MNEHYELVITTSAQKEIRKLPKTHISRIISEIALLAKNPRPSGCKKLVGSKNAFRIRIGDYRVLYSVEDVIRIVEISGVRHRREAYD